VVVAAVEQGQAAPQEPEEVGAVEQAQQEQQTMELRILVAAAAVLVTTEVSEAVAMAALVL
jgi:hypothetical protein